MHAPRQALSPEAAVDRALHKLKQAEADLLAALHPGGHPDKAALLEAHAFLWEAISTLSKAASPGEEGASSRPVC